jgi:hypothetical protein
MCYNQANDSEYVGLNVNMYNHSFMHPYMIPSMWSEHRDPWFGIRKTDIALEKLIWGEEMT